MIWPFKQWRRARLRAEPMPDEHWAIVMRNVPIVTRFTPEEQARLKGHMNVFLGEKRFEGARGLEITDEVRLTIAAQACLLILNHDDPSYYPRLRSIIVYPHRYIAQAEKRGVGGVVSAGKQSRLGESWDSGYVVLSWDDVRRGACCTNDGHNLVYHEFAHQLDSESGSTEGAPVLPDRTLYSTWAQVLGNEFAALRKAASFGEPTLLRKYGATSPAEFFAVATEVFFEQPAAMQRTHPELYEQLKAFYRHDPAVWCAECC